jgi:hypothetical protein
VRPPAVVVGVGWVASLAAIRSLGRAGVQVIAVDDRACALGFRSRYAVARGVDLTRLAYLDAIGERPAPVRTCGDGTRWAITLARGARPAFQRPPYVDAMRARDDPRAALVHLARVLRP